MKTNVLKTAIVAVAISFVLTSCENDTLNELETRKPDIEQLKPTDNHTDRDLKPEELKRLPIKKEIKKTPHTPKPTGVKEQEIMKEAHNKI